MLHIYRGVFVGRYSGRLGRGAEAGKAGVSPNAWKKGLRREARAFLLNRGSGGRVQCHLGFV